MLRPVAPCAPSVHRYPHLAHHACEIPFVFHVLEAHGPSADEYYMHGPTEVALSASMATYWRNHAAAGDPNGAGLPAWAQYTHDGSDTTMVFGDVAAAEQGVKRAQCDMWDALYGWNATALALGRRAAPSHAAAAGARLWA